MKVELVVPHPAITVTPLDEEVSIPMMHVFVFSRGFGEGEIHKIFLNFAII